VQIDYQPDCPMRFFCTGESSMMEYHLRLDKKSEIIQANAPDWLGNIENVGGFGRIC